MKKTFTYLPVLIFIIILIFIENSLLKGILSGVVIFLIAVSKYKRSKINEEYIEFDDRVNINISKWSLRFMFLSNLLLTLFLIFASASQGSIDKDFIIFYLLLTLFIPFYIIPTIIKKY
ncbi:hypothetical protein AAF695_09670 [Aerococcus viridans]